MEKPAATPSTPPLSHGFPMEPAETPSTPQAAGLGLFPTPQTVKRTAKRVFSHQSQHDATEEADTTLDTPESTPRKKMDLGKPTLFALGPSTVGKGRRYSNQQYNSVEMHPHAHNAHYYGKSSRLIGIKNSIRLEIDEEEEEEDDDDMKFTSANDITMTPKKIHFDDDLSCSTPHQPSFVEEPFTPPTQIMDEEFISQMNIETCNDSDDVCDVQRDVNLATPQHNNPFASTPTMVPPQTPKVANPRYEAEIEMVYHATGERFFIPQDHMGLNLRPKNLTAKLESLSGTTSSKIDTSKLLQTPRMQMNKDFIEYSTDEDDDNGDQIVGSHPHAHMPLPNPRNNPETPHRLNIPMYGNPSTPSKIRRLGTSAPATPIRQPASSGSNIFQKKMGTEAPKTPKKVLNRIEYVNNFGDKVEVEVEDGIKPKKLNFD